MMKLTLVMCALLLAFAQADMADGRRLSTVVNGYYIFEGSGHPADLVINSTPDNSCTRIVFRNCPNVKTVTFQGTVAGFLSNVKKIVFEGNMKNQITSLRFKGQTLENLGEFDFFEFPNLQEIEIIGHRTLYSLAKMKLHNLKKLERVVVEGDCACGKTQRVYVDGAFNKKGMNNHFHILSGGMCDAASFKFRKGVKVPYLHHVVVAGQTKRADGTKVCSLGKVKKFKTTCLRRIRDLYWNPTNDGWTKDWIKTRRNKCHFHKEEDTSPVEDVDVSCGKFEEVEVDESLKKVKRFRTKNLRRLWGVNIKNGNCLGRAEKLDFTGSFRKDRNDCFFKMTNRKFTGTWDRVKKFTFIGGNVHVVDVDDSLDDYTDVAFLRCPFAKKMYFRGGSNSYATMEELNLGDMPELEEFKVTCTTNCFKKLAAINYDNFFKPTAPTTGIVFPATTTNSCAAMKKVNYGENTTRNKAIADTISSKLPEPTVVTKTANTTLKTMFNNRR